MTPKRPSFSSLACLVLTCGAALLAGAACEPTAVDPVGEPPSEEPSATAPPSSNGEGQNGNTRPIPDSPIGPYTGLVGTTDVSILYPMPDTGSSTNFVRPTEVGNHGQLLPEAYVDTVLEGMSLDRTTTEYSTGYADLALVSVRLDPCAARGVPAGSCKSEVRAVFQAIYQAGPDPSDPVGGSAAADGAIHVMYDVDEPELVKMMKEILTLKKANGDLALDGLAPHPILASQGLGGPFAQGLRNIILAHLGADRIGRITVFDHNFNPDSDGWTFQIFERKGATFQHANIAALKEAPRQLVAGSSASAAPIVETAADHFMTPANDSVASLVSSQRPTPSTPEAAGLKNAFEAALRVQNPTLHTPETTDCANCHLAEGARQIGEKVYALTSASAFTHSRSLAYKTERTSVTNLHAFGYLHRKVSIMQRTANESVIVATSMESKVK